MAQVKKLKASTLPESIVAMVIIIICLSISTAIIANVMSNDHDYAKLKCLQIIEAERLNIKKNNVYIDSEEHYGAFIVKKKFENYKDTEKLLWLKLTITDAAGHRLVEQNELISTQ